MVKFLFTNRNMKTTARTCILLLNTTQSLPEKCYANDISKITSDIKEQQLYDYIEGEVEGSFADNSKAGICSCSTDNCNGAINSVSASAFVLLTSTAVAYFSKFL
ncbi:unnamed protein product [Orchesella dallaii]|uniref:Protein quiver n=1 Tax=Orchesella dallaii TaxID=48710 RepID=A0ABP1RLY9_9HEXA